VRHTSFQLRSGRLRRARAFTLLELLLCVAIIGALLALLVPALSRARKVSYAGVCANNLRQIGIAFSLYTQDNADRLPNTSSLFAVNSDWKFGGLDFVGTQRTPLLSASRPINRYVDDRATTTQRNGSVFQCPGDVGVWARADSTRGEPAASILPARTCFLTFGNSYRSNPLLLDRQMEKSAEAAPRGYAMHEVTQTHSRVLLAGDAVWHYATRPAGDLEGTFDASWHGKPQRGNMLALDGSARAENFADPQATLTLRPR
jgi:prepilin-type N-terminal cleavage/methylation domain-containing protein